MIRGVCNSRLLTGHDEFLRRREGSIGARDRRVPPAASCRRPLSSPAQSINSLIEQRTGKVDYWKTSNQRQRWLATALLDIEPRLRRIKGCKHLPLLRQAMRTQMKTETKKAA